MYGRLVAAEGDLLGEGDGLTAQVLLEAGGDAGAEDVLVAAEIDEAGQLAAPLAEALPGVARVRGRAERDVVDVPENRVAAVMADQSIEDAAGNDAGVIAAVRNRYPRHPSDPGGHRSEQHD